MPRPFDGPMVSNAEVLQDRPELAVAMMRVLSRWAVVERELTILLCSVTGDTIAGEEVWKVTTQMNHVAKAAMDATVATRTRLEIAGRAIEPLLEDELKLIWQEIRSAITKRSRERNKIAHAILYTPTDKPKQVVLVPPNGADSQLYSLGDFDDILSRLDEVVSQIEDFRLRVLASQLAGRTGTV